MHRTQVLLEEHQYARLRELAAASGRSIGELVRTAVNQSYGNRGGESVVAAFRASHGAWADREMEDGAAYVEGIRPGLGHKTRSW